MDTTMILGLAMDLLWLVEDGWKGHQGHSEPKP